MASSLENPRDVLGGMLMAAVGGAFLWVAGDLDPGSALRMGAGYFPRILGTIMVALGLVIALLAMREPAGEWVSGQTPWRGVVLVLGALLLFGVAVRGGGLLPVVTLVVFATAAARSVSFERACAVGPLERLPMLLAHHARNADLVIVGEPDFEHSGADEALLVETAFMDTGRPALVLPHAGALRMPPPPGPGGLGRLAGGGAGGA